MYVSHYPPGQDCAEVFHGVCAWKSYYNLWCGCGAYLATLLFLKIMQLMWFLKEMWVYSIGEMIQGKQQEALSLLRCSPQMQHTPYWNRSRVSDVTGRRLTAWVMAWPTISWIYNTWIELYGIIKDDELDREYRKHSSEGKVIQNFVWKSEQKLSPSKSKHS